MLSARGPWAAAGVEAAAGTVTVSDGARQMNVCISSRRARSVQPDTDCWGSGHEAVRRSLLDTDTDSIRLLEVHFVFNDRWVSL